MEERNSDAPGRGGRKRAFTLDEHRANGRVLQDFDAFLAATYSSVAKTYGVKSRAARHIESMFQRLHELQCDMVDVAELDLEEQVNAHSLYFEKRT